MLWAATFVSVLRAYFHGRVSPYRFSGIAALMYVYLSYPSICYIVQLYYHLKLDDINTCNDYFTGDYAYGYPDESQSKGLCASFRWATFTGLMLFILMHFQIILCAYTYFANVTREQQEKHDLKENVTSNPLLGDKNSKSFDVDNILR